MSDAQLYSLNRIAENHPQHRDLLRSYLKARPTKSLTPTEFDFLDTCFRTSEFIDTSVNINLFR